MASVLTNENGSIQCKCERLTFGPLCHGPLLFPFFSAVVLSVGVLTGGEQAPAIAILAGTTVSFLAASVLFAASPLLCFPFRHFCIPHRSHWRHCFVSPVELLPPLLCFILDCHL
ncbi:hypothetical protein PIB30_098181 [Stylosanthes scabra]|uniref:Uncharacterized protein n=1 Tax=Stylosanthes scabra TaxID=79078 RepID=A0ABU6VUY0_9FABA|nr:hypothetical protein [Stylosanthes scabra]